MIMLQKDEKKPEKKPPCKGVYLIDAHNRFPLAIFSVLIRSMTTTFSSKSIVTCIRFGRVHVFKLQSEVLNAITSQNFLDFCTIFLSTDRQWNVLITDQMHGGIDFLRCCSKSTNIKSSMEENSTSAPPDVTTMNSFDSWKSS